VANNMGGHPGCMAGPGLLSDRLWWRSIHLDREMPKKLIPIAVVEWVGLSTRTVCQTVRLASLDESHVMLFPVGEESQSACRSNIRRRARSRRESL